MFLDSIWGLFHKWKNFNNEYYKKHIVKQVLCPWDSKHFENKYWTFRQDFPPVHIFKATQDFWIANQPYFNNSQKWATNSPILNFFHFSFMEHVRKKSYCKPHRKFEIFKEKSYVYLRYEWVISNLWNVKLKSNLTEKKI